MPEPPHQRPPLAGAIFLRKKAEPPLTLRLLRRFPQGIATVQEIGGAQRMTVTTGGQFRIDHTVLVSTGATLHVDWHD